MKDDGHLDILVNNAGIGPTDDVEKLISINLVGVHMNMNEMSVSEVACGFY